MLVPLPRSALWPDLIALLLHLLRPHQLEAQAEGLGPQADGEASDLPALMPGPTSIVVNRHALSALSMEKTVEILAALYR